MKNTQNSIMKINRQIEQTHHDRRSTEKRKDYNLIEDEELRSSQMSRANTIANKKGKRKSSSAFANKAAHSQARSKQTKSYRRQTTIKMRRVITMKIKQQE